MSLKDELQKVIHGEVDDTPAALEAYSRDASLFMVRPQVVVHPRDADDICIAVRFAAERKKAGDKSISLTARSAGTDMSGGPLNDSIILDITAHLNHLIEVKDNHAVVEPGMYFRDFDRETKEEHLELPSYTASREINTVGGMVANNSGGEKNLKYGKTDRYVEELEVVLSDGEKHLLKNLSGEELRQKLNEQSFEGEIYRQMSALLRDPKNKDVIERAKPQVEKNSSGYALWDMGDGTESLNLARLFVGSQGTLGIITKICFSLVKPKLYAAMTVLFLKNLAELGELIPAVLLHLPDSFESYDDHTFSLGVKYFPEFVSQLKTNLFRLGIEFLPEMWMVAVSGVPKLVLMVEFRADTQEEALSRAQTLATEVKNHYLDIGVRVARDEKATRKYWVIRRESFNLLRKKIRGKRTAPFIDDFVVPPYTLPDFLPKLEKILSRYDLTYTVAGHVGDDNFHIIPLVDPKRPDTGKIIDELSHKVYDLVLSYHGSITGEHNDGYIRTPYVEKMFGPEMYALFVKTKEIFDPSGIFNPGKKVGLTFSEARAKLDLPTPKKKPRTRSSRV